MVPRNKFDLEAIDSLNIADDAAVLEVADELLSWLQDVNWPVFQGIAQRLSNLGNELQDPIEKILSGDDSAWKANLIGHLIPKFSVEAQLLYMKQLKFLLEKHDENDVNEGVIEYVKTQLENAERYT